MGAVEVDAAPGTAAAGLGAGRPVPHPAAEQAEATMSEHPAVAFLVAAHERAERLANVSSGGKWSVVEMAACACCDLVRNETGGLVTTADQDDAPLIAEHANPAAVLARVAAERDLLAEHSESNGDCSTCVDGKWGYPVYPDSSPQRYPCRTVLGLAAGWGWEAEA